MRPRTTAPALTGELFDPGFPLRDPEPLYERLRADAPVVWHEDPGVWIVSRHAEVCEVNRDTTRFSSTGGILALEIGIDYPSPPTMMHTDPPVHTRLRHAVAAGFRPSRIAALEPAVADGVAGLVADLPVGEAFDVVRALSAPLPLMVICDLLGLPSSDWPLFWRWSDAVIPGAADLSDEDRARLHADLESLLRDHVRRRRAEPAEDIVSDLVAADGDGRPLDDEEIHILVNQLLIAGNETTRNLISGGLVALAERPDQWEMLRADRSLVPSAVEELLRWTTPVVAFMRTATGDTVLGGEDVRAGDPVLMLWAAANRDHRQFGADAGELHVDRSPNHHLAFGFGPHFCVGAALARLEGRLVLEALLDRYATLEVAGDVVRSPSSIIAGFQSAVLLGRRAA